MNKVLIYYPFTLSKNANSGSKLRPIKMLQAFQEWGLKNNSEILLISGTSKERERLIKSISEEEWKDISFCYMENQTIPFWLTDPNHIPQSPFVDLKLMRQLKKHSIPTGVFYRDVYWKFDDLYPLKGYKRWIMRKIYRLEELFYSKYMKVLFVPSDAMASFVDVKSSKVALPPGGSHNNLPERRKEESRLPRGLYVGGINNPDYGLPSLVKAAEMVNKDEVKFQLTIVCRKEEFEHISEELKRKIESLSITVKHISGQELNELYSESDFAFIPRKRTMYHDFSVPVKLVEYLSNHLPVLATNCSAQEVMVQQFGPFGIVSGDQPEEIHEGIIKMIEQHGEIKETIKDQFLKHHSWLERVNKVETVLLEDVKR
ncbi:glycosyltransferase [Jeotgalibacillus sp. R-1-5s-1]|uniref:glycosyltransferase n=1 Tax=Jeotgalibacillus sp. R-1-5s-1 TaxID=2555897 RepID=UPI00106C2B44|nr:glycosyltransferase [Jeotgalibacillus sp. R-1-5s-1]TFD95759.1 glycosyltransferase family 1 protein [Jeotgalibacillus sp. R-1-5s-1]